MTDNSRRQFTKQVAIKATDDAEQIATGLALTADEVDHQLDFFRAEGVQAMFNPDPDHGVMHGRFPDDDAELVRNEVLDEDETIDGAEFEAGNWVVQRQYHNDELWDFVERGVLNGYSIGGEVTEGIEFDSIEDLPDDVEIPDTVDPDAVGDKYWPPVQVTNGFVSEISDVDIPAVVSAQFATTKADKSIVDDVAGEDEFVAVMAGDEDTPGRGHSEEDARDLWGYLESIEAADAKHAMSKSQTDPDAGGLDDEDVGFLKRLRKAFSKTDANPEPDDDVSPEPGQSEVSEVSLSKALDAAKEGRPLNADNREALMAAHDAVEASLASDKDFETNRFTDDPDSDFDLTDYADKFGGSDGEDEDEDGEGDEKAAPLEKLTEEQGDLVVNALQRFVDAQGEAPFSDFQDWVWQTDVLDDDTAFAADEAAWQYREFVRERRDETPVTEDFVDWVGTESDADADLTMSKDKNTDGRDDPFADAPEWAKALKEQQEKNSDRITEELSEKGADGGESGGDEDAFKEAPEWAKALKEEQEKNAEQIDAISKQTGASQQLPGVEKGNENGDMDDESAQFKKALGGGVGGGDI
ncbi:XkdF-like putative serine protease domain-containing protein [Natronorubrum sp. FCH18a]|uniref:XkdF-like putative serine protease domain-containing protein n=1 Tax=Natronorubrum sp. FCH18a TaxID=3447018 RepID=UPI003F514E84